MSAQPADVEPRDAGPVRVLRVVPDAPETPRPTPKPPRPAASPEKPRTASTDRVTCCLLYLPVGGLTAACAGHWWALAVYAAGLVALVVWTARGE